MFEILGANRETANKDAATVMRIETELAKASMTRVDRRDPYKLKHKMKVEDLSGLAPKFDWKAYYREAQYPGFEVLNVNTPDFFKETKTLLASEPLENWKTYLRVPVSVLEVCRRKLRVLPEVPARGKRTAATMEPLCELYRSQPG